MAINKVGSKGIEDGAVAAVDFADETVSSDKFANATIENAKLSNSSITAAGSSISLGGSATFNNLFIDWQSVVTGDTTMVAGRGYFVDTSSSTVTMTLPSSANRGDTIAIKDYAGTFASNNLTIGRNGHKIQGESINSLITTNRASLVLVYVDTTKGWLYEQESNVADLEKNIFVSATGGTVATSGDFKIHTFTGDGCFVVSAAAGPVAVVDYLVVAGGGAGGGIMGGGGGAGGYRESHSTPVSGSYTASPLSTPTGLAVTATTFPVTVGSGGAITLSGGYPSGGGSKGSASVFSTITSAGGGGNADCSGVGGSGAGKPRYTGCGAAGNTPPVSPPQGNPGGAVPSTPSNQDNVGGGGGGAGAAGGNANSTPFPTPTTIRGGPGGNGVASEISGSSVTRAGGGGGGTRTGSPTYGAPATAAGGSGGGGNGGYGPPSQCAAVPGTAGSANTGGGGGGGHYHSPNLPAPFPQLPGQQDRDNPGGAGGKGIVIIRYKFQ